MSILLGIFHKVNTGYWPISPETVKKISNYTALVNILHLVVKARGNTGKDRGQAWFPVYLS